MLICEAIPGVGRLSSERNLLVTVSSALLDGAMIATSVAAGQGMPREQKSRQRAGPLHRRLVQAVSVPGSCSTSASEQRIQQPPYERRRARCRHCSVDCGRWLMTTDLCYFGLERLAAVL
jgi:hypothetical protein